MAERIVIEDLRDPVLNEAQREALRFTANMPCSFDSEGILAEAAAKVGLSDFGPPDFRRRLDLLCDEWGSDAGLTNLARLGLRQKLVTFSRTRLLVHDLLRRHPEIRNETIDRPVVVCGLPRSGTTHLLNLLAADRRLRSLPLWESYEPIPLPGESARDDGEDPRYRRCRRQWETSRILTPLLAAMHPMEPDHIHEELELMGPDFASYNFEWLSVSPRWRDDYLACDQTPHYEFLKTMLQVLQWQDRQRGRSKQRWVLKCPQHLEQLPVLRRTFADATVVITHRDPVSVVQSAITMLAYGQRMSRVSVGAGDLLAYWSDRVERLLSACVRDRATFPASQSVDLPFDQFMADDVAAVLRIHDKAGLESTQDSRRELEDFARSHPRGLHGQVVYRLEQDFGVRPEQLRERFAFYFDAFPVTAE